MNTVLLPISEINATAHEPVLTSTNNGYNLLDEVEMIRVAEGQHGHYLAVMAPPTTPGGLDGVPYDIGSWSSFSVLNSEIIAHEFGHNRALLHAPCGFAGGPDPFYPYEEGNIGAWGYDFDTAELVSPRLADFMSYCGLTWTSDYQFNNAVRYRLETEAESNSNLIAAVSSTWTASERTLMLWGDLNEEGEPYLSDVPFIKSTISDDGSLVCSETYGTVLYANQTVPILKAYDEVGTLRWQVKFADHVQMYLPEGKNEGGRTSLAYPPQLPGESSFLSLATDPVSNSFIISHTTLGPEEEKTAELVRHYFSIPVESGYGTYLGQHYLGVEEWGRFRHPDQHPPLLRIASLNKNYVYAIRNSPFPVIGIFKRELLFLQ